MSTDQQRIDEIKKHLAEMRRDLSTGAQTPEKAAQCACMALLTLVDLMDFVVDDVTEEPKS